MDQIYWMIAYMALGLVFAFSMWASSGDDLTLGDLFLCLFIAVSWPVVFVVFAIKVAHDVKLTSFVIWKRK